MQLIWKFSVLHYGLLTKQKTKYFDIVCFLVFFCFFFTAHTIKAGQENVATVNPGLFACKWIYFENHFSGKQQVNVLASIGHREKSLLPRNSAALWIESITTGGFKVCILEYGKGSNKTAQVNWISFQRVPVGSQIGSIWFNSFTSGTECKKISFKQVRKTHFQLSRLFCHHPILNF